MKRTEKKILTAGAVILFVIIAISFWDSAGRKKSDIPNGTEMQSDTEVTADEKKKNIEENNFKEKSGRKETSVTSSVAVTEAPAAVSEVPVTEIPEPETKETSDTEIPAISDTDHTEQQFTSDDDPEFQTVEGETTGETIVVPDSTTLQSDKMHQNKTDSELENQPAADQTVELPIVPVS